MDAYDDYIKDIGNGKFNLLRTVMEEDDSFDKVRAHKKIAVINKLLMLKMKEAFRQVLWNKHENILYNIISFGCTDVYLNIVRKRYPAMQSII